MRSDPSELHPDSGELVGSNPNRDRLGGSVLTPEHELVVARRERLAYEGGGAEDAAIEGHGGVGNGDEVEGPGPEDDLGLGARSRGFRRSMPSPGAVVRTT